MAQPFELNTIKPVELRSEHIGLGARVAIVKLLAAETGVEYANMCASLASGDDYTWRWASPEGKLPKRLARFVKQTHGHKLNNEAAGRLGSLAGADLVVEEACHCDVDTAIDWDAGEFGDENSCFWGGNRAAKPIMRDNGC